MSTPFERLLDALNLPLDAGQRRRLIQTHEARRSPTRPLPSSLEPSSTLTLAHVGHTVYAVDEGCLHVFDLAPDVEPLTQDRAALIGAYRAHRENPAARASDPYWTLTMDDQAGVRLRGWGGEDELAAVFQEAGVDGDMLARRLEERGDQPEWMDAWERYAQERQAHHQAQADRSLEVIRQALPEGILARLNRFDLGVGELAHWVMAKGRDRLEYRLQAIEQQPYFLTRALMATGQWAVPQDKMTGPKPRDSQPTAITPELRAQGQALAEAIDAGQSWTSHLLPILNNTDVILRSRWKPQTQRTVNCSNYGSQLTLADIQLLAGKPPAQSFVWMLTDKAPNYGIQMALLSSLRELSAARRPKTVTAAQRLARIVERTQDRIPLRAKGLDAFLKGLPNDLDDPVYQELDRRLPLVADTYRWMHQGHFRTVHLMQAFRTLTWLQVNKFADRAHVIEIQRRDSTKVSVGPLEWMPSLRGDAPVHEGLLLHELCTENELKIEGHQMDHCVGSYGVRCGLGEVRIFSVRNLDGESVSTLAIERDRSTGELVTQQHFGPGNQTPPAQALAAETQWMAQATRLFKRERWMPTEDAEERRRQETNTGLPHILWEEACRRYPSLNERYQAWVIAAQGPAIEEAEEPAPAPEAEAVEPQVAERRRRRLR